MRTAQDDLFGCLFEHRDRRIDRLGNPLLEFEAHVDWDAFRPLLDQVHYKFRKSSAGRNRLVKNSFLQQIEPIFSTTRLALIRNKDLFQLN
jgi:hypothetical protein